MSSRGAIKRWQSDIWFSKAVRLSHDNTCQRCGRESTELAHIRGRRDNATRYAVDNGLSACHWCHKFFDENPIDFIEWLDAKFPGRRQRIQIKARGILKNTAYNRKLISAHYREEYRRMESTGDRDLESWN